MPLGANCEIATLLTTELDGIPLKVPSSGQLYRPRQIQPGGWRLRLTISPHP